MKTITNLHLLPTDEQSLLHLADGELSYGKLCQNTIEYKYQNIYLTLPQSDLEISKIKVRDWIIVNAKFDSTRHLSKCKSITPKGMYLITSDGYELMTNRCEKIIATTDKELRSLFEGQEVFDFPNEISHSFLEHYVTEYNKGNIIKDVEVELEKPKYVNSAFSIPYKGKNIKLTPNREVCIVVPEEKTYSREEVVTLIKQYEDDMSYFGRDRYYDIEKGMKNWLKENL